MIGIIGGSGLGNALGALGGGDVVEVDTPFGRPSGPLTLTEVEGVKVALLARHGPGHIFNPSRVPYRANVFALKQLGVTQVVASGAVGSLQEEIVPRDLVIPDQLIDKTFRREGTFFDDLAAHVEFASPFCPSLRSTLVKAGEGLASKLHSRATLVCMEGPQFSTRAESDLHRGWGAHLIGMTAMPEAKLAREAELCYALVALPTDYDCWRPHPTGRAPVELTQEILDNLKAATEAGLALIRRALPLIAHQAEPSCPCQSALASAIWTDRSQISAQVRRELKVLVGKYL